MTLASNGCEYWAKKFYISIGHEHWSEKCSLDGADVNVVGRGLSARMHR